MNWMSSKSITGHKSKLVTDSLHLNTFEYYYIMNQSVVSVPCFVVSSFSPLCQDGKLQFQLVNVFLTLRVDTQQPMKQKLDVSLTECETDNCLCFTESVLLQNTNAVVMR